MRNLIMLTFTLMVLVGCGENKVDGSSTENLANSIEKIKASLDEGTKNKLESALIEIIYSSDFNLYEFSEETPDAFLKMLDGKTVDEIILAGDKLANERKERERKQINSEIEEIEASLISLEKRVNQDKEKIAIMEKFKVLRSRFYYKEDSLLSGWFDPRIELTVKNETDFPISRAYFSGVLQTPGRAVPWVNEDFNYSIRGGLEPGEEVTWTLAPNSFSEWGQAPEDRNDMVLTVAPYRIDGADGNAIVNLRNVDTNEIELQEKKERQKKLKESLLEYDQGKTDA